MLDSPPRESSWPPRPAGTAGGCVARRAGPAPCAAAARPPAAPAPADQTAPGSPVTSQTDSLYSTLLSTAPQLLSSSRALPIASRPGSYKVVQEPILAAAEFPKSHTTRATDCTDGIGDSLSWGASENRGRHACKAVCTGHQGMEQADTPAGVPRPRSLGRRACTAPSLPGCRPGRRSADKKRGPSSDTQPAAPHKQWALCSAQ